MKKIFLFALFTISLPIILVAIGKYDHHINSKLRASLFIENLERGKIESIYKMFDKSYAKTISLDSLETLLQPVLQNRQMPIITTSKIKSNDIFTIQFPSGNNILIFSFGDGWGKGWKVKHLRLLLNKYSKIIVDVCKNKNVFAQKLTPILEQTHFNINDENIK